MHQTGMRKPIQLTFERPTPEELGETYGISKERQAELLEIMLRPAPRKPESYRFSDEAFCEPGLPAPGTNGTHRSL
jgi:hypothetical protein